MFNNNHKMYIVLLMLMVVFSSCNEGSSVQFETPDSETADLSQGFLHNEILYEFNEICPIMKRDASRDEFKRLFIVAANGVYEDYGLSFRITAEYVDEMFNKFDAMKEGCGYDFFSVDNDLEKAVDHLAHTGEITAGQKQFYLSAWRKICMADSGTDLRIVLTSCEGEINNEAIEVAQYSSEFWAGYVDQHPELSGWWNKYRELIKESTIIGSDFLGCVIAGPGCAAGAALGSLAAVWAWWEIIP